MTRGWKVGELVGKVASSVISKTGVTAEEPAPNWLANTSKLVQIPFYKNVFVQNLQDSLEGDVMMQNLSLSCCHIVF